MRINKFLSATMVVASLFFCSYASAAYQSGMVQSGSICVVDYTDAQCQFNEGGCKNIFALSISGMIPVRSINYFIAAAACGNFGKHMLTNEANVVEY